MKLLHRLSALAMTAVMAFSISGGVSAADAATATIDTGHSTSLTLYKYDLTGAENDGIWDSQSYVSTGLADEQVNTALSQYAIQGVEFSYRKLADLSIYKGTAADGHQETVPLYAFTENTKSGSKETIDFLAVLGLTTNDAYHALALLQKQDVRHYSEGCGIAPVHQSPVDKRSHSPPIPSDRAADRLRCFPPAAPRHPASPAPVLSALPPSGAKPPQRYIALLWSSRRLAAPVLWH